MPDLQALKEQLIREDEGFQQLYQEHQDCERQLAEISQKAFLSQEDEIQEKQIKVHKLRLKDEMHSLLQAQLETAAAV